MARKSGRTETPFLTRVNGVKITADLLGEVLEMHAAMAPEDRGAFEVRAMRLFELLDRKGLDKDRALLSMAIEFRLTALARLQHDQSLRGWSMPGGEPGLQMIHADLLKAAAEEPLVEGKDGEAAFDAGSFQRRVLACAEASGNG